MSNDTNTAEFAINDTASAQAVVTMVKNQIKNETGKYADYIANNGVTVESVSDHVKALREMAYPNVKADGRAEMGTPERNAKRFADKVRNGLRHNLGDSPADRAESTKVITALGLKSESWDAFVTSAKREWDAANNK